MARCSVLIPAYNVEAYVAQSIESALAQTHPDTEVIVVNDGSTDGTAEAIAPYRDRIVYVEQENRGLAAARNRALEEVTGEYVALLDADDMYLPHRLERMLGFLEGHPEFGFATSDAFVIYGDEASTDTYYRRLPRRRRFRGSDQPYWIVQYNFVYIMAVVRRALFERHGTFDEGLGTCEDWDLWMRFITSGERVGLVDEPLGYYRIRGGSLSYDRARVYADVLTILERCRARPEPTPGAAGRIDLLRAAQALDRGEHAQAAGFFRSAARDPTLRWRTRLEARAAAALPRVAARLASGARPAPEEGGRTQP